MKNISVFYKLFLPLFFNHISFYPLSVFLILTNNKQQRRPIALCSSLKGMQHTKLFLWPPSNRRACSAPQRQSCYPAQLPSPSAPVRVGSTWLINHSVYETQTPKLYMKRKQEDGKKVHSSGYSLGKAYEVEINRRYL